MSHPRTQVFAHLSTPTAPLYRRVMAVFMANKRRFVVHLRPEDVAEALRGDGGEPVTQEQVDAALSSLRDWGNLRADPDTGRVTTVEDFYRARFLYQLSKDGEAAERALEVFEQELGRRGELQAVALEDIRVRLHALAGVGERPDPAIVHNLLLEVMSRLDSLAANAIAFMGGLQRTIDLQDIEEEAFLAYKDRLISYLERFVSELVVKAFDIAEKIRGLERVDELLRLAAERETADAAPGEEDDRPALESKLAEWRDRWSGLRSWFVGDRAHPCQADLLRTRARQAIPDLLATISVLHERRAGRSDRSADFRTLARWFAQCPSDADAHRLWRAAFGLTSARHLTVETEPAEDVPAATSWLEAPQAEISVRLRATGSYTRRGAPSKVVDRSAQRERLAAFVAAEREQAELARKRLATGRPVLLSELGELDPAEFRLFLRLLGEALALGPGEVTTRTADGALEIRLRPVDGYAEIRTEAGVLRGPDHELVITDLVTPREAAAHGG
ncbi:TIGR02677 family protein [Thermoactinospora rubra]|uniref:TIGR02677 family protein n=1 Tax=Thermoactinospora rubra TaxID=1088767 RepID=UPI000A1201E8|nr:TIGR02677 family protein [Thermoactinospora rubra]